MVYWSALTTLTGYNGQGGFGNRNLLSPSSGGLKSAIEGPARLISSDGSSPVCKQPPSPCILTWAFLCVPGQRERLLVSLHLL